MDTNQALLDYAEEISSILQIISPTPRIAILLAIGRGEACVCHLESILGWRQAYLSQHLMTLRKADILLTRRSGRYIYYRLKDVEILTLLRDVVTLRGLSPESMDALTNPDPGSDCECPHNTLEPTI